MFPDPWSKQTVLDTWNIWGTFFAHQHLSVCGKVVWLYNLIFLAFCMVKQCCWVISCMHFEMVHSCEECAKSIFSFKGQTLPILNDFFLQELVMGRETVFKDNRGKGWHCSKLVQNYTSVAHTQPIFASHWFCFPWSYCLTQSKVQSSLLCLKTDFIARACPPANLTSDRGSRRERGGGNRPDAWSGKKACLKSWH